MELQTAPSRTRHNPWGWTVAIIVTALLVTRETVVGISPFHHGWDKVSDVMGMHGTWRPNKDGRFPSKQSIEFAARNYPQITAGTGCYAPLVNTTFTIENAVLSVQAQIKTLNPSAQTGM